MKYSVLSFSFLFILFSSGAQAQTTYYPAKGFYNGFLNQVNILECDNNNNAPVDIAVAVQNSAGQILANNSYNIAISGSRHVILNDVANITDNFGTYTISLPEDQASLGDRLNCRTSFYRPASNGIKTFEYAYVVPVQNAQVGVLGGIYNSMDPGNSGVVTENWLSIINFSDDTLRGDVKVYAGDGSLSETVEIANLAPGARQDIPLGHPNGNTTGLYQIVPDDPSLSYEAFVVRYNPNNEVAGFRFAFPLRALRGSCSGEPLLASTMGNGLTDNWLEIANISELAINATITVKDRNGAVLFAETRSVPAFGQSNLYLSSIIDAAGVGNVGTATVTCEDKNDELVTQSTFYGKTAPTTGIEWAYSTQARDASLVDANSIMNVPVNTYASMTNWLKLADSANVASIANFLVYDSDGTQLASGDTALAAGGTADIGVHAMTGADKIGSVALETSSEGAGFNGEMLRVLPRSDGGVGNIVSIPGIVQQNGEAAATSFGDTGFSFRGDPQSLAPYKNKLSHAEASHFLEKVALGGTQAELEQLKRDGLKAMVKELLTLKKEESLFNEARRMLDQDPENDLEDIRDIRWEGVRDYWMHFILNSKNPLREKMALVLHDLFATSCSVVDGQNDQRPKCLEHVDLIRKEAFGNYRRLLLAMNTDFTMLIWLNNNLNVKEQPDENYAREHWELFSTGEPSAEGGKFPIYTDADVAQAARAFTGWTNINPPQGTNETEEVAFIDAKHDEGEKVLWAGTPYESRGNFKAEDITNLTLDKRPEAARFVARRIFVALVHDHPSPGLVNQLAKILKDNDWDFKPLIRVIINSEAMFSKDALDSRIKDPITYLVGFIKRTGIRYTTTRLQDELEGMGFVVSDPPGVNGWPGNKFQAADKSPYWLAWQPQYSAAIIDIFNYYTRDFLDEDDNPLYGWDVFLPSARASASEAVDHLVRLMGVQITSEERQVYIDYMDSQLDNSDEVDPRLFDPREEQHVREKLSGLLFLLAQHESYLAY